MTANTTTDEQPACTACKNPKPDDGKRLCERCGKIGASLLGAMGIDDWIDQRLERKGERHG